MKQFTPQVYNIDIPVGFDIQVASMQAKLACINFVEALFGVCKVQYRIAREDEVANGLYSDEGERGEKRYRIWYPQGRKKDMDIDLSPDDTYASRGFFLVKDPIDAQTKKDPSGFANPAVQLAQPFSFIFFCNLDMLELTSSEIIKNVILQAFNTMPKVNVVKIFENIDNVWNEFTINAQISNFTRYPFYTIRLDCICTYDALPVNNIGTFNPMDYITNRVVIPNVEIGNANLN